MKERPILFSAPMVRALLDGRKTQTRRIVKRQPGPCDGVHKPSWKGHEQGGWWCSTCGNGVWQRDWRGFACPYGVPGDLLWVREAFMPRPGLERVARPPYRADKDRPEWRGLWKPSIHMPRWASRIVLRITDVRVERLNDISADDAVAEGLQWVAPGVWAVETSIPVVSASPADAYLQLWDHIHGEGAAAENPWVWAVTFELANG